MSEREPWCDSLESPSLLHAFDYADWSYYVAGHDEDALLQVDEPEALGWERVWMRPVKASHLDEFGCPDDQETVTRGRFAWTECHENDASARPFLAVKYLPIGVASSHSRSQEDAD